MNRLFLVSILLATAAFRSEMAVGKESTKAQVTGAAQQSDSAEKSSEDRIAKFAEQMSNVKLVGRFTVVGKDDGPLAKEEYTISKVEKLPEGDKWLFHCRIKYGKHDLAIPLPIDVKWAGDTPIITLTDLTIPGLGTFSSRVVIHENKYAGTWRHDKVGGHLFGVIEQVDEEKKPTEEAGK